MRRVRGVWLLLAVGALAIAVVAQRGGLAQDKKDDKKDDKKSGQGAVTLEELGKMLEDLGYDVERPKEGASHYTVKGGSYSFAVMLSSNKENIWLEINLTKVPEKPASDRLEKLLEGNFRYGRAAFKYWPSVRALGMQMPFENHGITPRKIRKAIDEFQLCISSTQTIWGGDLSKSLAKDFTFKAGSVESASPSQAKPAAPR